MLLACVICVGGLHLEGAQHASGEREDEQIQCLISHSVQRGGGPGTHAVWLRSYGLLFKYGGQL